MRIAEKMLRQINRNMKDCRQRMQLYKGSKSLTENLDGPELTVDEITALRDAACLLAQAAQEECDYLNSLLPQ